MYEGFVKGLATSSGQSGQFVGDDPTSTAGVNAIRIGDGFHDYLLAAFVSCNHSGVIPPGRAIQAAQLRLRPSRIYGSNPFLISNLVLVVDMVRGSSLCTHGH